MTNHKSSTITPAIRHEKRIPPPDSDNETLQTSNVTPLAHCHKIPVKNMVQKCLMEEDGMYDHILGEGAAQEVLNCIGM